MLGSSRYIPALVGAVLASFPMLANAEKIPLTA